MQIVNFAQIKFQMNSKQTHIYWIDTLKVLGIYLVVLGHLPVPEYVSTAIYAFHMPLFFFISGFLINQNATIPFKEFVSKKVRTLLIPYFIFAVITYIFWVVIGRNYGNDSINTISIYKPLLGIFYSNAINDWMIFNIPLWFLTCLFVVEIIFYFVRKLQQKYIPIALICFVIIGYFDSTYMPFRLPWGIDVAFTAIVFFGLGYVIKQIQFTSKVYIDLILTILAIGIFYFLNSLNGRIDLNTNVYNNILYFYITAFCGIYMSVIICKKLPQIPYISFIAKNTLIILSLHGMAITILKAVQVFAFKIPLEILSSSLGVSILYSILAIVILIPVMIIIEKYFPFIIGKKKI